MVMNRRDALAAGAGLLVLAFAPSARATPAKMQEAIRAFAGERPLAPGLVKLEIPPLVENGNSVPVAVSVESPMTPESHVRRIALFNEKNPQSDVAVFHLSPRSGRAAVQTRMRLADSQTVIAVAELSDGRLFTASADVIVTLAACLEG
jgi:sulfur-oxidizing protein SoxY